MFIINRGEAEVVIGETPDRKGETVVAVLKPNAYFGEMALFRRGGCRRSGTVRARGPLEALYLLRDDLDAVLADYPAYRDRIMADVAAKEATLREFESPCIDVDIE